MSFQGILDLKRGTLLAPRAMPLSRESFQFNEENYFVFIPPPPTPPRGVARQFSTAPVRRPSFCRVPLFLPRAPFTLSSPAVSITIAFHLLLVCADPWKILIPRRFDRFEMFQNAGRTSRSTIAEDWKGNAEDVCVRRETRARKPDSCY